MTVSALVSAYYCAEFLPERLRNLAQLNPRPEIVVACHADSPEENAVFSSGVADAVIQTTDIPTWGAAINACIRAATGGYLAIANSDDLFYPQGLNYLAAYLDAHPECGIVHGDCNIRKATGIYPWTRPGASVDLKACRVGPMPMWRASLHKDHGLFDETFQVCADYDFWLRCVSRGVQVGRIEQTVGLYWKRENSLEHRNRPAMIAEDAEIRRRYANRTPA